MRDPGKLRKVTSKWKLWTQNLSRGPVWHVASELCCTMTWTCRYILRSPQDSQADGIKCCHRFKRQWLLWLTNYYLHLLRYIKLRMVERPVLLNLIDWLKDPESLETLLFCSPFRGNNSSWPSNLRLIDISLNRVTSWLDVFVWSTLWYIIYYM